MINVNVEYLQKINFSAYKHQYTIHFNKWLIITHALEVNYCANYYIEYTNITELYVTQFMQCI